VTVFRAHRPRTWHVIHETKTLAATRRLKKPCMITLCGLELTEGVDGACEATCLVCMSMDDPLTLSSTTQAYFYDCCRVRIGTFNAGVLSLHRPGLSQCLKRYDYLTPDGELTRRDLFQCLKRYDYLAPDGELTRRGHVLLLDYSIGPVPAMDNHGITHTRNPLSKKLRCGLEAVWPKFMSTAYYAEMRKKATSLHFTCISCHALC
jgi:hypothetical protein